MGCPNDFDVADALRDLGTTDTAAARKAAHVERRNRMIKAFSDRYGINPFTGEVSK
jgi:hypothetical protein